MNKENTLIWSHFALTEKSCSLKEAMGKVTLYTPVSTTKSQIRLAFSREFPNLKILSVNSISLQGKQKRFKGRLGKRSDVKKMILTIESGSSLDLATL